MIIYVREREGERKRGEREGGRERESSEIDLKISDLIPT